MAAVFKEATRNPRVVWALCLYAVGMLTYFALTFYLESHRPHVADGTSGRIHPLRHFGSVVYLTTGEERLLLIAQIAPYIFLLAAMLINARELMRSR